MVDTCQPVDAKKRPQSVSIEHLQLCDPQGNGKGNLSKRKWHRHRKKKKKNYHHGDLHKVRSHNSTDTWLCYYLTIQTAKFVRWKPWGGERKERKNIFTQTTEGKKMLLNKKKLSLFVSIYLFSLLGLWKCRSWLDCLAIVSRRAGGVREEGIRRKGTICWCLLISRPL